MTEATLKAALRKAILKRVPKAVVYRHEDHFTAGIPDLSVTLPPRTVWIEVKFANRRKAEPTKLQALALRRLDGVLLTYRIQKATKKRPYEIRSTEMYARDGADFVEFNGFAHDRVADEIADLLVEDCGWIS